MSTGTMPFNPMMAQGKGYTPVPQTSRCMNHCDTVANNTNALPSYSMQMTNNTHMANSIMIPPAIQPATIQSNNGHYYEFPFCDPQHHGESSSAPSYAMMHNRGYSPVLKCPTPSLMYMEPMGMVMHAMKPSDMPQNELAGRTTTYDASNPELSKYRDLTDAMTRSNTPVTNGRSLQRASTPTSTTSSTGDMEWHDESIRYKAGCLTATSLSTPMSNLVMSATPTASVMPMTPTSTYSSPSYSTLSMPLPSSHYSPVHSGSKVASIPRALNAGDHAFGRIFNASHPCASSSNGMIIPLGISHVNDPTLSTCSSAANPFLVQGGGRENEKVRKKKETHNAIERLRRDSINSRILELCHLVPCLVSDLQGRLSKSCILKKSGEYIKQLRKALKKQTEWINQTSPNLQPFEDDQQMSAFIHEAINYEGNMDLPPDKESNEEDSKNQLLSDFSTYEGRMDMIEDEESYDLFPSSRLFSTRLALEATDRRSVSPATSTSSAPSMGEKHEHLKLRRKAIIPKKS